MAELSLIARHAGTVLVGQLAVMAFGVTDTIVAGRYSQEALAALSVGSAVYVTIFVSFIGLLQAQLPVWAELFGGARGPELGRSVRQALYLVAFASAAGVAGLLFPGALLRWTEVPPALQEVVRQYLAVLALALPAALLFRVYSTLNQALQRPKLVTWLQIGSLAVKVPLTVWFAFGGAGLPAMGAVGCGLATVVVMWLFVASSAWMLRTQALYEPFAIWARIEPPHWPTIARFARLGIPSGAAILVEVTSFTLMALFIARQGTLASAAHQVVSNLAAILYMMPLSIAIATSSRVSYWLGAGDARLARSAIRTGLKLGLSLAFAMSLAVLVGRQSLAALYSPDAQVVAVAAGLLAWLAFFHIGDAIQGLCVFILRCYHVAIAPLVAYCLLLWGVGLAGGYLLAYRGIGPYPAQHSPAAFWIAAATALAVLGVVLLLVLWRAVRSYSVATPAEGP